MPATEKSLKFAQLNSMPSDLARLTTTICVLLAIQTVTAGQFDGVYEDVASHLPWMQLIRRDLHKIPELKYTESKTSTFLRKQLDAFGISYQHPFAKHGIVATLGSGKAPCMALRTDMDALPIPEELDVPYRSTHPGLMHACGHDAHMTMLLAASMQRPST